MKDCWSQIHLEASRSTSISKRSLILAIALVEYLEDVIGAWRDAGIRNGLKDPEKFAADMRSALRAILLHALSDIFSYRINMN